MKMNRPEKLTHLDTIIYEIDMLEYCYHRLSNDKRSLSRMEAYGLLECFLLHYRNLIDFLGKKPTRDDLSVTKPKAWAMGMDFRGEEIQSLNGKGKDLWQEYEDRKRRSDTISRYLQHCTEQRTMRKDWPLDKMYKSIRPLVEDFRQLVGNPGPIATDGDRFVVGPADASTGTSQKLGPLF
jgi:hypothetical protein